MYNISRLKPGGGGGGGGLSYEGYGDARRKFWIKPLKETTLGMAQAFWFPKRDHFKTKTYKKYSNFSHATLNETFTAKYNGVLPRTP